jgi:hypothetical protein
MLRFYYNKNFITELGINVLSKLQIAAAYKGNTSSLLRKKL